MIGMLLLLYYINYVYKNIELLRIDDISWGGRDGGCDLSTIP